jgi:hypothetical protein
VDDSKHALVRAHATSTMAQKYSSPFFRPQVGRVTALPSRLLLLLLLLLLWHLGPRTRPPTQARSNQDVCGSAGLITTGLPRPPAAGHA